MVSLVTWEAMPQPLPSPTLTNPDMILPDLDQSVDSAVSTPLQTPRPLSPRSHLIKQGFRLDHPPVGRRGASSRASIASSTYSRQTDGEGSADGETTPKSLNPGVGDALAHEHRLNGVPRTNVVENWQEAMERKSNSGSGLVHSNGAVDGPRWPAFDASHDESDTISIADSEWRHRLSYMSTGDETDNEQWSSEDEANNSAALSRRAEAILANAKKRLNLMEGNLRGARKSFLPPNLSSGAYRSSPIMSPILPPQPPVSRNGDGPRYVGLSHLPPRQRNFRSQSHASTGSGGHSRGYSEINVSSENLAQADPTQEKRATSALGSSSGGRWTPDDGRDARETALRGVRSHEVMRTRWGSEQPLRSGYESSLPSPSLETLREDEDARTQPNELRRSASTTSDLRTQMYDLKGRIFSLKDRARDESIKKRSMQNLRTPSPFTASELWYSGADAYGQHADDANGSNGTRDYHAYKRTNGTSPLGSPLSPRFATQKQHSLGLSAQSSPVSPGFSVRKLSPTGSYQESTYEDAEEHGEGRFANGNQADEEDAEELDDSADLEDEGAEAEAEVDQHEVDADSLYNTDQEFHDAQVTTERHEDRADAFDYENFFLHSAMGTYRKRASSASSESSVETTRAISPVRSSERVEEPESPNYHRRSISLESISTLATFSTATEGSGSGSDDGSENAALGSFTQQALGRRTLDPRSAMDKQRLTDSGYGNGLLSPTPSMDSLQEHHGDPAARIMAGFFTPTKMRGRLTPLGQKDEDLLYALTTSIQQVVSRLQTTTEDDYEARVWRRRLDQARKILDGVPSEEV